MEKMTSKQSLQLASCMVNQHHMMGNSHVKIASSDISHDTAVSSLKSCAYEVSGVDAYSVANGFVTWGGRSCRFLAVEPIK